MKTSDNQQQIAALNAELATPTRSRSVVKWVDHFLGCTTCRKPETSFPAQAKPRNELCDPGRKLLDVWLDEE